VFDRAAGTAFASRAALVAACILIFAFWCYFVANSARNYGRYGVETHEVAPFTDRVTVWPHLPAARAGLRSGDLVDVRAMSASDRWAWRVVTAVPGYTLTVPASRDGRSFDAAVTVERIPLPQYSLLAAAGTLWTLICCAVIAWRRGNDRNSAIIVVGLLGLTVAFMTNYLRMPVFGLSLAQEGIRECALLLFKIFPGIYVLQVAGRTRWLRGLAYAAFAAAGLAFVTDLFSYAGLVTARFDLSFLLAQDPLMRTVVDGTWSPFLLAACLIGGIVAASPRERPRVAWVGVALIPLYFVAFVSLVLLDAGYNLNFNSLSLNVAEFFVPAVLTYAMLSRRLLDVGFVLNRAVVFSGVSIVLIGTFVLIEWALTAWLSSANRTTNIAVSAAVALVLGLSVRFIHARVDRFVDSVFFRKRHENERALALFAREAPYITDAKILLARAEETLRRHAGVSFARILLAEAHSYGDVSENDPAIVRLGAAREALDLNGVETKIQGDLAYPMVARGRLVGALVLGPRVSDESYAPDESAAIAQLATSVGNAVDAFAKEREMHREMIEAIRAVLGEMAAPGSDPLLETP
jgi:hypothetical protein